jgi:hypothetical protein
LKNILRWKNGQVLRNMYAGCVKLQELDLPGAGTSAKYDSKWLFFSFFTLVFGQPTKVEFHLPLVLWPEASLLQLYSDQSLELPIVEEQVDIEVFSVELNALLASDEGKTGTQFQQEHLQLPKDSVFKVPLLVMVLQIKEVEDVWIFENQGPPVKEGQGAVDHRSGVTPSVDDELPENLY